ncbi:pectin lyase-like protein [Rhizodiscina lignyota]|uniref:Pectin lyase-like protein n=1 Tax=Rhizodiscina lignyota TaxID=1504668 RepID=A0A9P4IV91_9PEZI|nr:pectin lyase-like protein [Rhizodiscina lignyota]
MWKLAVFLLAFAADIQIQAYRHGAPAYIKKFWLEDAPHEGTSPFLVRGHGYKVFRNVKDYGAKGDGITDDTDAFNAAINDGGRCSGGACGTGTTGQPALIYVPSGKYVVSSPIQLYVDTQVIGDAINLPTIKAASRFSPNNESIIAGFDPGTGSTTNFYIGVRNLVIDSGAVPANASVSLLNWAVSQATNLINVNFVMPVGSQHSGIIMDGGSGGGGSATYLGDLTFSGGLIGIHLNNQQYAFKNCKFTNVATGIAVQHLFVGTFQGMHFEGCGIGVDVGGIDDTGSVALIDSTADNVGTVVNGSANLVLENLHVTNSGPVLRINGTNKVTGSLDEKTYVVGHLYYDNKDDLVASKGTYVPYTKRGALTDGDGLYLQKPQPQYTEYSADAFVSVKDHGAKGDGQTDDTVAINALLKANANCKITYFPHGVYLVTDTIYVPPGSRIVGEVWSTISATGSKFADESNPHVMFQVGKPGEVGTAEVTDMLFTVADVLPGAIMVQINMAGKNKGDVSFHNSHFRSGGAADSNTETECQTDGKPCKAAFMMFHIAPTAQIYIENTWLWTADHDLDGDYNQVIGTGRGMYIESTKGVWLVGTASEHHVLYAYQLYNAQNVFVSMQQVETPYNQPIPQAPTPWTPNPAWHDPDFSDCDRDSTGARCHMQWALRIIGEETKTINIYGSGFWVFFNNYTQDCGSTFCQENIVDLENLKKGDGVELYNLNTRGTQNLITLDGNGQAAPFQAAVSADNPGSWGAIIAAYLGFE